MLDRLNGTRVASSGCPEDIFFALTGGDHKSRDGGNRGEKGELPLHFTPPAQAATARDDDGFSHARICHLIAKGDFHRRREGFVVGEPEALSPSTRGGGRCCRSGDEADAGDRGERSGRGLAAAQAAYEAAYELVKRLILDDHFMVPLLEATG